MGEIACQYPPWRPTPPMSTALMVSKIQQYVESFKKAEKDTIAAAQFRKTMQVHFVHSVCGIEGESLDSVEDSLQAVELWRCRKERRCKCKGSQNLGSDETGGRFSEFVQLPKKMLTMSLVDTGFDSLSDTDTETCLRGVNGIPFDTDKLHSTLALYEALQDVDDWETHPYPQLDISRIKQLHSIMFSDTDEWHSAGIYRSSSAWTRQMNGDVHTYLSPTKVPKALNDLVRKVNMKISETFSEQNRTNLVPQLLHLVSCFFTEFEAIHPFHDGNGRVGRLLAAYLLAPLTPFGPNVLYFHSLNKLDLHGHFMFVNRETFLEALEDDEEDGRPERTCALIIEGIYVAWEMFSSACPF